MQKKSRRIRVMQLCALFFLVASNALNYIDRSTIAIANPLIRSDLGLSLSEIGLVMSVFLWIYSLAQIPVGIMVDRVSSRAVLAIGLAVWSLAQAAGGVCGGLFQLMIARVFLAVGEAVQFPVALRVLKEWYTKQERGRATGIFSTGSSIGTAIAAPTLTYLMVTFSWRWMFVVMGIIGLALAMGWYLIYRDVSSLTLTRDERDFLSAGDVGNAGERRISWREWSQLLRFRATWGIVIGVGAYTYVNTVYYTWLPAYLAMDRHMSITRVGLTAGIPFLFGIVGSLAGGYLVDLLVRRGMSSVDSARVTCVGGVLCLSVCTLLAAETASTVVAILAMSAGVFGMYINLAAAWTLAAAVAPPHCVGSMAGLKGFGGYVGASLAPILTGFLAQKMHTFHLALLIAAAFGLVSALCFATCVRRPISMADSTTGSESLGLR